MPRWDKGYGVQIRHEWRTEEDLLLNRTKVGRGFGEDVEIVHVEGVYTWDKSIRVIAKFPYVLNASRELPDGNGGKFFQHDSGPGDPILALPLKKYFNLDGRSGSWTMTPQIQVPMSGSDEYEVYENVWGQGISFGYETETYRYILHVGASAWFFGGDEPFTARVSLDIGVNFEAFNSNGHVKWESDYFWEDDESATLYMGPALYYRFSDEWHGRLSYRYDFYDKQGILDHGNGSQFIVGVAFVY